ncbi:DUF7169 domain-containing protein [Streptomyces umbrinus]|uniref:DUF7169 domain-containing protein n=1 Tax=Streptomyces umbrinus TaxID=67370 RepID=UPI00343DE659
MNDFVKTLQRELDELRLMLSVFDDAVTMPGRGQSGMDADGGRQATHGPSRPTEVTALDPRRNALQRELKTGAAWLPRAIAMVRGVNASMNRALSKWEGEDTGEVPGGLSDHHNGAARH